MVKNVQENKKKNFFEVSLRRKKIVSRWKVVFIHLIFFLSLFFHIQ